MTFIIYYDYYLMDVFFYFNCQHCFHGINLMSITNGLNTQLLRVTSEGDSATASVHRCCEWTRVQYHSWPCHYVFTSHTELLGKSKWFSIPVHTIRVRTQLRYHAPKTSSETDRSYVKVCRGRTDECYTMIAIPNKFNNAVFFNFITMKCTFHWKISSSMGLKILC